MDNKRKLVFLLKKSQNGQFKHRLKKQKPANQWTKASVFEKDKSLRRGIPAYIKVYHIIQNSKLKYIKKRNAELEKVKKIEKTYIHLSIAYSPKGHNS